MTKIELIIISTIALFGNVMVMGSQGNSMKRVPRCYNLQRLARIKNSIAKMKATINSTHETNRQEIQRKKRSLEQLKDLN